MHSIHNSNTFLAYYNQIDKYLDTVLKVKNYMPYSEKVQTLAEGNWHISRFVAKYQNKLRYFGDLRNQIVHGFAIDKQHYVVASDYAVEQIKSVFLQLTKPRTIGDVFQTDVYSCKVNDSLQEVIACMRNELNTHVPVYDEQGVFVEMLSESTIAYRLADTGGDGNLTKMSALKVSDIPLENSNDFFVFEAANKNVYEIEQLFAQNFTAKKRLGAVFITENGDRSESISGIITAMDLPRLAQATIL